MYQLHSLRRLGMRVRVLERGSGVGGTWFWNRYPGARCDAPSLFYSVSYRPDLDREWRWTERFAPQPEILAYMEEVARREDMLRDITFDTSLVGATWDDASATWTSSTDTGERITSRYLILATGCLSSSRVPAVPGLDGFGGRWFHTGRWPQERVDFTGRRVAVVGTGSTGAQVIPVVAAVAEELTVFQRTPKFVLPASNAPLSDAEFDGVQPMYPTLRDVARRSDWGLPFPEIEHDLRTMPPDQREALLRELYDNGLGLFVASFADHLALKSQEVNDIVADFVRRKIAESVHDPSTAATLTPRGYPIGVNRIVIATDYYETFNRDNVRLHSVLDDPIVGITPTGLRTQGREFSFDDLIFATGYDAITGSFARTAVRDREGRTLSDHWDGGARSYLGMQMAGFPNLFLVTGPGGPSVLGNVIVTAEQSIDFITRLIEHGRETGHDVIETDAESEASWMRHVADVANATLYRHAVKANAWFVDRRDPAGPGVFLPYAGGVGRFGALLDEISADGFRGFHFHTAGEAGALDTAAEAATA